MWPNSSPLRKLRDFMDAVAQVVSNLNIEDFTKTRFDAHSCDIHVVVGLLGVHSRVCSWCFLVIVAFVR